MIARDRVEIPRTVTQAGRSCTPHGQFLFGGEFVTIGSFTEMLGTGGIFARRGERNGFACRSPQALLTDHLETTDN